MDVNGVNVDAWVEWFSPEILEQAIKAVDLKKCIADMDAMTPRKFRRQFFNEAYCILYREITVREMTKKARGSATTLPPMYPPGELGIAILAVSVGLGRGVKPDPRLQQKIHREMQNTIKESRAEHAGKLVPIK